MNNEETKTDTPATPAAQQPAAQPAAPAAAPTSGTTPDNGGVPKIPENLSAEDKAAFEALVQQVKAAQEAAAKAKQAATDDGPWYWNRFSKGVYCGLAVAGIAVGGYVLYKQYTGSAE